MNYGLLILSFIFVAFGQPAWIRGFGVLAAAFGFALFWKAMLSYPRSRDRFVLSVIWFCAVQGVQLSWMTTMDYMGPLIIGLYFFLILGVAVQFGALSLFFRLPLTLSRIFSIAGCWVLFEWLRLFFLCGFTWNPVGLSMADSPYSLQIASLFGIFGLSFWVIVANLLALSALLEKSVKKISLWAGVALFPYLFGMIWIAAHTKTAGTLEVALVQTGLFPEQKELLDDAPHAYIHPLVQWGRIMEVLDAEKKLDLIVLPEAALPLGAHNVEYDLDSAKKIFHSRFFPPLKRPYALYDQREWKLNNVFFLQALANQFQCSVIAGLDDADINGRYNAAFHFLPNDKPYERYEKRILVPVGEYLPLRQWRRFSRFVAKQFGIYGSFDQGTEAKIFHASFPLGICICVEETFSGLIRELRLKGAEIFVNVTNDVWFPRSKLARQHFDHGRVRAAENGVAILRSCNTGVTGAVDCFGRPIDFLPISEQGASSLYLTLPVQSHSTLYTWWGDSAILGISAAALLFQFLRGRKSE